MARKKLNYRFYNPNPVEVTADYILKVFIDVNERKVEEAMREATEKNLEKEKFDAG